MTKIKLLFAKIIVGFPCINLPEVHFALLASRQDENRTTFAKAKQKIAVFPLTRPTLNFCADPVIFIAIKNKIKRLSCLPTHKLKKYCPS